MNKMTPTIIPHSRPTLGTAEADAVAEVIGSGYIAEGETVKHFETAFAKFLGLDHATSTNSGTSALHLTLLAMGIGQGDEVIIPSYVCSALLNAVHYSGATPILADIDADTCNLDVADVQRRINRRTKAIIVPHLFGLAADLDALQRLDVPIIEDCAQAIGAVYHERPVGTVGQAGIYSFYATKVMTTGEGGMVATNSRGMAEAISDLKNYDKRTEYKVRYNYKMTDIQAALGIVQLKALASFIRRRRVIAKRYHEAFKAFDLRMPPTDAGHIYFRYVLGLAMDASPWIKELARMGIVCERPIHRPLHQNLKQDGYQTTDQAWKRSLSIPIYPTLSDDEIERVIESVSCCCEKFS